jgi:hypothetical protein
VKESSGPRPLVWALEEVLRAVHNLKKLAIRAELVLRTQRSGTGEACSEFDAALGEDTFLVCVFHFAHFGHSVGELYQ